MSTKGCNYGLESDGGDNPFPGSKGGEGGKRRIDRADWGTMAWKGEEGAEEVYTGGGTPLYRCKRRKWGRNKVWCAFGRKKKKGPPAESGTRVRTAAEFCKKSFGGRKEWRKMGVFLASGKERGRKKLRLMKLEEGKKEINLKTKSRERQNPREGLLKGEGGDYSRLPFDVEIQKKAHKKNSLHKGKRIKKLGLTLFHGEKTEAARNQPKNWGQKLVGKSKKREGGAHSFVGEGGTDCREKSRLLM